MLTKRNRRFPIRAGCENKGKNFHCLTPLALTTTSQSRGITQKQRVYGANLFEAQLIEVFACPGGWYRAMIRNENQASSDRVRRPRSTG
jgi:hypothetical protein